MAPLSVILSDAQSPSVSQLSQVDLKWVVSRSFYHTVGMRRYNMHSEYFVLCKWCTTGWHYHFVCFLVDPL